MNEDETFIKFIELADVETTYAPTEYTYLQRVHIVEVVDESDVEWFHDPLNSGYYS